MELQVVLIHQVGMEEVPPTCMGVMMVTKTVHLQDCAVSVILEIHVL